MDWQPIGKAVAQFFLMLIEYSFKICAVIASFLVLGTQGSFTDKFQAGFSSLSRGIRKLIELPADITEISVLLNQYSTQTPARFAETYGADTANALLLKINGMTQYLLDISANLNRSPLVTLSAALLVFFSIYLMGWVIRFARQQGQGSLMVRMERNLGERIFGTPAPRRKRKRVKRKKRASGSRKTAGNTSIPASNGTTQKTSKSLKKKRRNKSAKKKNMRTREKVDRVTPKKDVDSQTLKYIIESARS